MMVLPKSHLDSVKNALLKGRQGHAGELEDPWRLVWDLHEVFPESEHSKLYIGATDLNFLLLELADQIGLNPPSPTTVRDILKGVRELQETFSGRKRMILKTTVPTSSVEALVTLLPAELRPYLMDGTKDPDFEKFVLGTTSNPDGDVIGLSLHEEVADAAIQRAALRVNDAGTGFVTISKIELVSPLRDKINSALATSTSTSTSTNLTLEQIRNIIQDKAEWPIVATLAAAAEQRIKSFFHVESDTDPAKIDISDWVFLKPRFEIVSWLIEFTARYADHPNVEAQVRSLYGALIRAAKSRGFKSVAKMLAPEKKSGIRYGETEDVPDEVDRLIQKTLLIVRQRDMIVHARTMMGNVVPIDPLAGFVKTPENRHTIEDWTTVKSFELLSIWSDALRDKLATGDVDGGRRFPTRHLGETIKTPVFPRMPRSPNDLELVKYLVQAALVAQHILDPHNKLASTTGYDA